MCFGRTEASTAQQRQRPPLLRAVTSSPRINLNLYWKVLEELASYSSTAHVHHLAAHVLRLSAHAHADRTPLTRAQQPPTPSTPLAHAQGSTNTTTTTAAHAQPSTTSTLAQALTTPTVLTHAQDSVEDLHNVLNENMANECSEKARFVSISPEDPSSRSRAHKNVRKFWNFLTPSKSNKRKASTCIVQIVKKLSK